MAQRIQKMVQHSMQSRQAKSAAVNTEASEVADAVVSEVADSSPVAPQ